MIWQELLLEKEAAPERVLKATAELLRIGEGFVRWLGNVPFPDAPLADAIEITEAPLEGDFAQRLTFYVSAAMAKGFPHPQPEDWQRFATTAECRFLLSDETSDDTAWQMVTPSGVRPVFLDSDALDAERFTLLPESSLPHYQMRFLPTETPDTTQKPHEARASVMARTIEHMENVLHLLAFAVEKRTFQKHIVIPGDIIQRYALLCAPFEPGSVIVPARLAALAALADSESGESSLSPAVEVSALFDRVCQAFATQREETLREFLPEEIARRVRDSYQEMLPQPGSGYTLELSEKPRAYLEATRPLITWHAKERRGGGGKRRTRKILVRRVKVVAFDSIAKTVRFQDVQTESFLPYKYAAHQEEDIVTTELLDITGEFAVNTAGVPVEIVMLNDISVAP
ncbi:hypothetical protein [Armatimonas sp.]|uniref:hypothetical protein n=1 Tax=Armatimonas sp. TaxID=1872638 RepID=UPI00374CD322